MSVPSFFLGGPAEEQDEGDHPENNHRQDHSQSFLHGLHNLHIVHFMSTTFGGFDVLVQVAIDTTSGRGLPGSFPAEEVSPRGAAYDLKTFIRGRPVANSCEHFPHSATPGTLTLISAAPNKNLALHARAARNQDTKLTRSYRYTNIVILAYRQASAFYIASH